jgi:hypothetical protein
MSTERFASSDSKRARQAGPAVRSNGCKSTSRTMAAISASDPVGAVPLGSI